MADRNWSTITNGATFQHLVNTLLLRVDPAASPYGRPGKDGAQDARSGDRKTVYQAKYHENATAAGAIADAKTELAKIRKYRVPGDPRASLWEGVDSWYLVTNAAFNAADEQRWLSEVVPIFEAEGLRADIWRRENLDASLDANPDIDRAFFSGENRVFVSLWEAGERYRRDRAITPGGELGRFCGRESELGQIADFAQCGDKLFLLLHGAGAAGKTRLLLEAGTKLAENGSQVLWAEAASMAKSNNWFLTLPRERPTILLLDEPDDVGLLKVLFEQLSEPGASWKVVMAVRSPNDPVVRWLMQGKLAAYTEELALKALPDTQAAEALQGMLATAEHPVDCDAAVGVARFLDGFPGWLEIAARLIATRDTLEGFPTTSAALASEYLDQILNSDLPEVTLRDLLRQVALYGRVNREDTTLVAHLAGQCGISADAVLTALAEQVRRRVLVERGAYNRLVEIKPDVMSDFILQSWLTSPVASNRWQASQEALTLSGRAGELLRLEGGTREAHALLPALARTELMLRLDGKNIDLLGSFIKEIETQAAAASPSHLIRLVEAMQVIAEVRPSDAVCLSKYFRSLDPRGEEVGLVRKWLIGKARVVGKLPWMLFHAARGAAEPDQRIAIINELLEIAALQGTSDKRSGESAASLLARIIAGGPDIGFDFTREAGGIALERLEKLAVGTGTLEEARASRILLDALVSRRRTQTWADAGKFHIARGEITTDSLAGQIRTQLLERTKELIEDQGAPSGRQALWGLLAEACGNLNSAWLDSNKTDDQSKGEILGLLQFAEPKLQHADYAVLAAARGMWSWHANYGPDGDAKSVASRLEALYSQNALAAEMEPLFGREHWESRGNNSQDKAREIASGNADEISAFLDRIDTYLTAHPGGIEPQLAWYLGRLGPESTAVREFVRQALGREFGWRLNFALIAASAWISHLRPQPSQAAATLSDLLTLCPDDAGRRALLVKTLGRSNAEPTPTPPEREGFFKQLGLFADQPFDLISVAANLFTSDPARCKIAVQQALERLADTQQVIGLIGILCEGLLSVAENLPPGTGEWLLDQILAAPRLYSLRHSNDSYYLQHVVEKCGRPGASWLLKALRTRIAMEDDSCQQFGFLGNESLTPFVEPLTAANLDEQCAAIMEIVKMTTDKGSVGHDMPAILVRLDPAGLVAPAALKDLLMSLPARDDFLWAARSAGEYPEDSESWRKLAPVVLTRAAEDPSHAVDYYRTLISHAPSVFQGSISNNAAAAAEAAEGALEGENDPLIKTFKQWKSQAASANALYWSEMDKEHQLEP